MTIHRSSIMKFLQKWETRQVEGYIPCRRRNFTGHEDRVACGEVIGASGVTIGTGVDLGQQDAAGLRRMGVSDSLVSRCVPYFGKQREFAVATLTAFPLRISEHDCDELDVAVLSDYIRRAAQRFDNDSLGIFDDLPAEAQTVIVSLYYHLGAGSVRYPKTWHFLCEEDWEAAARELRCGFTRYTKRRIDEARLLERLFHEEAA